MEVKIEIGKLLVGKILGFHHWCIVEITSIEPLRVKATEAGAFSNLKGDFIPDEDLSAQIQENPEKLLKDFADKGLKIYSGICECGIQEKTNKDLFEILPG